jgi:hypothetical protein
MPRRTISPGGNPAIASPLKRTCSRGDLTRPLRLFRKVLLPAPLAPITATSSASASSKSMPNKACASP